ncbi:MAG: glycosyl transferase [Marivibrio sp.]|uniref:glycosyl transferase n=1 Tax=Marivibrio sp. TaxID=2039719 RepID=UPI0032EAAE37
MPLPEVAASGVVLAQAGLAALAAALGSAALTGVVRTILLRRQVIDHPNARSSHTAPTPRGGGIAVVGSALAVLSAMTAAAAFGPAPPALPAVWLAAALMLAAISFRDDVRPLPAAVRLGAQAIAVLAALPAIAAAGPAFQGLLPAWLDLSLAALVWIGFVNFFNFMDGIDGIAGVETAAIGLGLAAIGALSGAWVWLGPGAALGAAGAAFLLWNWRPAKIFLGDVGSVPLGFLLGGLLLTLAGAGFWASAVILPLYYLADAGITLLRRLLKGERVWEAHRSHFYQRAAAARGDHAAVARAVALANAGLVAAALAATLHPWPALGAAAGIVGLLLVWMTRA